MEIEINVVEIDVNVNVVEVEINEIIKNLFPKRPAGLNKISRKMAKTPA